MVGSCEQRSESSPMDMAVQEAVEGILGKRSRIGLEVNLHEERVLGKGCKKCDEEDAGDGEGAGLVGVGRAWMFLLVLKLYQMDVTHAILLATKSYILRATEDYLSAKYELYKDNVVFTFPPNSTISTFAQYTIADNPVISSDGVLNAICAGSFIFNLSYRH